MQISELEPDRIELTVELFLEALKEFHKNMVETYVRVVTVSFDSLGAYLIRFIFIPVGCVYTVGRTSI